MQSLLCSPKLSEIYGLRVLIRKRFSPFNYIIQQTTPQENVRQSVTSMLSLQQCLYTAIFLLKWFHLLFQTFSHTPDFTGFHLRQNCKTFHYKYRVAKRFSWINIRLWCQIVCTVLAWKSKYIPSKEIPSNPFDFATIGWLLWVPVCLLKARGVHRFSTGVFGFTNKCGKFGENPRKGIAKKGISKFAGIFLLCQSYPA